MKQVFAARLPFGSTEKKQKGKHNIVTNINSYGSVPLILWYYVIKNEHTYGMGKSVGKSHIRFQ